jgi:acyl-CoA dehydrogenase
MHELLRSLLSGGSGEPPAHPIDAAMLAGVAATRVSEAFLAGYQAALRALVPDLPPDRRICLCATEEGGAHPRAIATRLAPDGAGWRLSGKKRWVTGGPLADLLLVVASVGTDEAGKNRLRVARVDARQPGVTLHPMPETPFTPEIPHAEVHLAEVALAGDALLPGDGYDRYLKPFRTVEDCHVHAAVLAYVLGVARRHGWPQEPQERLLAILLAARAVALSDPSAPGTHLALAGVLGLGRQLLDDTAGHWALTDPDTRARWQRDAGLLGVAQRARTARTEAAWAAVDRVS